MDKKEAIEIVREYYPSSGKDLNEALETLIPELKESEDERVRKHLVKHFQNKTKEDWNGMPVKDILAWLEKQRSQNLANSAKTCKVEPKFKVKYAGSEYNVLEVKDIAGVTFYGIEDEPNHIDYVKAERCEIIGGYTIKENGSPYPTKPAVFSEKKTAWSEEDEYCRHQLIVFCENCMQPDSGAIRCANWLKSIKERVQPLLKQEWSEEDERMINSIIKNIDEGEWFDIYQANWLRSLKDRVQPQLKQEWSEEDESVINKIESWLDTLCDYLKDSSSDCIPDIKDVINKLKSLKYKNYE